MFAKYRPISTICQHLYTFGVEVKFTRMWEDCGGLSDCEEFVVAVTLTNIILSILQNHKYSLISRSSLPDWSNIN